MGATGFVSAFLLVILVASLASACPFCSVTSQTLSEEIAGANAVVLARYVGEGTPREAPEGAPTLGNAAPSTSVFEIAEIIKGANQFQVGDQVETIFFGKPQKDELFLITGIGLTKVEWMTPLPLTAAAVEYVRQLPSLPAAGADRLDFFQKYLEHDDPMLDQDAYDEFARAPYSEVINLKDRMDHGQLVAWIEDPEVNPSRRRLYLTLLGVCGSQADLPLLERMILSDVRVSKPIAQAMTGLATATAVPLGWSPLVEMVEQDEHRKKLGLDALVACYLTLGGPDRLDVIDRRFLNDPEVEYTYVYSTIMALRFHGEETDVVPRERLLRSMRLLLDNPDFADQVIPDLARWEDWSVLDRLVSMFKAADENSFVQQPVVSYLIVAGEQEGDVGQQARGALAELEELDPKTVERARSLAAFGVLSRARPAGGGANAARPSAVNNPPAADGVEDNSSEANSDDSSSDEVPPDPTSPEFQMTPPPNKNETLQAKPTATGETQAEAASADLPMGTGGLSPPHGVAIVGIPLFAASLLVLLFWLILRGSGA